jgi:putative peptidoglycan lipid II flippase
MGRGVLQISGYIDTLLASLLVAGAVGALVKAQVLYLMPIALFAISVAAAELPELSRLTDHAEIRDRAQAGFRRIAFFISFIALSYVVLGDLIVATLFERREFSSDDTMTVWVVLLAYAIGLPASALSRLTQNTLWSQGDTTGPARVAFVRTVVSAVLAAAVMWWFDGYSPADARDLVPATRAADSTDDTLRLGAMGIALAASVAGWTEAIVLGRLSRRAVAGVSPLQPLRRLAPAIASSAAVAVIARFLVDDLWAPLAALIAVGLSGLAYLGVARATHIEEVDLVLLGPLARHRRH